MTFAPPLNPLQLQLENITTLESPSQQNLSPATIGRKSIEWAAGLFEGEGCLTHTASGWQMKMKMTDSDVMVEYYLAIHCMGNLNQMLKNPSDPKHCKPHREWNTGKRDTIFQLVCLFYPYMGERRRAKFDEYINWYRSKCRY